MFAWLQSFVIAFSNAGGMSRMRSSESTVSYLHSQFKLRYYKILRHYTLRYIVLCAHSIDAYNISSDSPRGSPHPVLL